MKFIRHQASDKLKPKYDKCIFVWYPKETKEYYFYNPIEQKDFITQIGFFFFRERVYLQENQWEENKTQRNLRPIRKH